MTRLKHEYAVGKNGGDGWTLSDTELPGGYKPTGRSMVELMQSKTEGLAALNDVIFPGTRSGTGKIKGGIYAERNRRFREANHRPQHYECTLLFLTICFN